MAMDLENLMKNFSLTKDEEDEVDLSRLSSDAGDIKADRCVVGRVLFGKPFNLRALLVLSKEHGGSRMGLNSRR